MEIDGKKFKNLRFADDIQNVEIMLWELIKVCGKVGMKINTGKTKFNMNNRDAGKIYTNNEEI